MAQDNYLPPGFYNEDCLPRMREYPDKHFDLAIVDPPYGGGFTEGGGCKGWFSKYHQVEQENKRELGVHFHERGRSKRYQEIISNAPERERERVTPNYNKVGGRFEKYKRPVQEELGQANTAKKS